MERPSFEQIYSGLALDLSLRSTCKRMKVGCVITTTDYGRVLSIGYNGNAKGFPNECDSDEPGKCGCIHAEMNAIVKCADHYAEKVVFCTHQPCANCSKLIINLGGVKKVVFNKEYRLPDGLVNLKKAGIETVHLPIVL